jgi:hypothetical protein
MPLEEYMAGDHAHPKAHIFNALRSLEANDCLQDCLDFSYSTRVWDKMLDAQSNDPRQISGATIPAVICCV